MAYTPYGFICIWVYRGNVLMRVFELKEKLLEFYSTEGNIQFCELLKNKKLCAMLAYLANIFNYINSVNSNIQGREENILCSTDKRLAFQTKIVMWKRKVIENNVKMFPLIPNNATTLTPVISEHFISSEDKNQRIFPRNKNSKLRLDTKSFYFVVYFNF